MRRGIDIEGLFNTKDIFREFDNLYQETAKMYSNFNDISTNPHSKELVKAFQTPEGEKVREVWPIVYGYSMTIVPDGKPHVREFGNIKSPGSSAIKKGETSNKPQISTEIEPLADVHSTDKEVKVIIEMPGTKKNDIKINAFDGAVEVIAGNNSKKIS
jgi:HSP20 family protein